MMGGGHTLSLIYGHATVQRRSLQVHTKLLWMESNVYPHYICVFTVFHAAFELSRDSLYALRNLNGMRQGVREDVQQE